MNFTSRKIKMLFMTAKWLRSSNMTQTFVRKLLRNVWVRSVVSEVDNIEIYEHYLVAFVSRSVGGCKRVRTTVQINQYLYTTIMSVNSDTDCLLTLSEFFFFSLTQSQDVFRLFAESSYCMVLLWIQGNKVMEQ